MPRLFIALPFNEANSKENQKEQGSSGASPLNFVYTYLKNYNKELKVVSPENYHMTLKFFGECSNKTAEKIKDNFRNISVKKKFFYKLSGLGVFPDLKKANVIWAGFKTDESLINKIINDIDNFASGIGFKKEKRQFMPHLTLARVRKGMTLNENLRQYIVENKEVFFFESVFKRIVLFESELKSDGPVYSELQSVELTQAPADE